MSPVWHAQSQICEFKVSWLKHWEQGKYVYIIDDILFINHHLLDLSLLRYDDHCLAMYGSTDLIPPDMKRQIIIKVFFSKDELVWEEKYNKT